jgi:hypothetical protein
MAVTIFEALQNANYNIQHNGALGALIAKEQLNNAVTLLEKGYDLSEEVEPLIDQYETVENVPEK